MNYCHILSYCVGDHVSMNEYAISERIMATNYYLRCIFHDDEREALEAVEASLDDAEEYAGELRFLMRKPSVPDDLKGDSAEEKMMSHVVLQMVDFYKESRS